MKKAIKKYLLNNNEVLNEINRKKNRKRNFYKCFRKVLCGTIEMRKKK